MAKPRVPFCVHAVLAALVAACQEEAEPGAPASPAPASVDAAALAAKLAQADAADGAADHVVARCPGCSLVMKGDAANSLEVAGYALHFCSAACRDEFAGNAEANVLALEIKE